MKKSVLIIAAVFFGTFFTKAATVEDKVATVNYRYGNSFIFVEDGVTFSVYPDGEFDFYVDNRVNVGVGAQIGNVGITFNSGFDYNPFVQFDDFGAVIQVENTPIFYDFYGRVSQIGSVDVWYRNGRVRRLGGLNVFYRGGVFSHHTGFINIYNRRYVYRPFHRWFARPAVNFCNVWRTPYRRYYTPVRYTWHRPYRNNVRRAYAQIGREYRYNRSRRANVYRNDRRVAVRNNNTIRRGSVASRSNRSANQTISRSNTNRVNSASRNTNTRRSVAQTSTRRGNTVNRSSNTEARNNRSTRTVKQSDYRRGNVASRSNSNRTVTKREVTQRPNSRTVTKRQVTTVPRSRTVKRSTQTTYKRPEAKRSTSSRSVASRSSSPKRTVSKSTRTTTVKRSTGNNSSRRSNNSSTRTRSSRVQ
ncbi:hypothetical protein LV716_17240 [Flagellimonas sp. HMM57]|uniref:hypothetical protein n=1 Tax=unclassified Flagellimonas TaxID=2644544 RepID=UPI0013D6AC03|nr:MULTISPECIES: hypothetical protein [unclassified Flagellimonas]UII75987.1 hypothetical protein LV716_17240 [Flagellimonas sp. HMM57]